MAAGWGRRIRSGEVAVGEVADFLGESQANVSRWYAAFLEDELLARRRALWRRPPAIEESLAMFLPLRFSDLEVHHEAFAGWLRAATGRGVEVDAAELAAAVEVLLERAADCFEQFRSLCFRDERGQPYMTPRVHKRWIRRILRAMLFGRRQLILSPPRHGKTQMLIHFVIWLICRFPNIRIMWIGGNETIAKNATGAVLDELENNRLLIDSVLGPGGSFKPSGRGGKSWSSMALTVATRVGTGIKSATLVAVGKGGKLLSRDADLIIPDDIIDHDSVQSAKTRDEDFDWINTQVSSRKEEHTAVVGIGSRQHHQDLWGRLSRNPAWAALVEQAHDPDCALPTHAFVDPDLHVDCEVCAAHVDCMLFPELRTYAWLQDQRASFDDDLLFEMVYQNVTRPEGADPVTLEHLELCRNPMRVIGDIPHGTRLIAGHDPASAGVQGNVLWAYDMSSRKRFLVDLEAQRAGGTPGFRKIMRDWFERYGVTLWIVETQNNNDAVMQDTDIKEFATANGITILSTYTTKYNKWSPDFGVPVQLELFKRRVLGPSGEMVPAPLIDIPFGDVHSREKVRPYEQQVMNFEPGVKNNGDLLMAGWIPENHIRYWSTPSNTIRMVAEDDFRLGAFADSCSLELVS